jgi:hypothetical protein
MKRSLLSWNYIDACWIDQVFLISSVVCRLDSKVNRVFLPLSRCSSKRQSKALSLKVSDQYKKHKFILIRQFCTIERLNRAKSLAVPKTSSSKRRIQSVDLLIIISFQWYEIMSSQLLAVSRVKLQKYPLLLKELSISTRIPWRSAAKTGDTYEQHVKLVNP